MSAYSGLGALLAAAAEAVAGAFSVATGGGWDDPPPVASWLASDEPKADEDCCSSCGDDGTGPGCKWCLLDGPSREQHGPMERVKFLAPPGGTGIEWSGDHQDDTSPWWWF